MQKVVIRSGNVITMSGTFDAGDTFGATINGVEISITATATTDAYTDDFSGLSAQLAAQINSDTTLNGTVLAVDNKDGSVTITQGSHPVIQGAETTLAKTQQTGLAFSQANTANVTLNLKDGTSHVDNEVNAVILELEDGTETRILGVTTGTGGDAALDAMKLAFDSMTTDQKNGFTMSAATGNNAVDITRNDGKNFKIKQLTPRI